MNKEQCPFKKLMEPKGPKGWPLINSVPSIARNPLRFFTKIREKYGDIASYKMFGFISYLVSHPDDIVTVFKAEKQHGTFEKEFFHNALYDYFGDGLFNSYGENWEVQRKQLKPYFQKSENSKWFPIIVEETLNHIQTVSGQSKINGKDLVLPVVQAVMCRVLFGIKPENKSSEELIKALELVSEKLINQSIGAFFFNGLLNNLPTPGNIKYKNALKTIDNSITKMSGDSDNKKNNGLLPLLSEQMSPKQIRDQLFTLFFAGQDTTANAILWTLYHLAKYPDVQNKVRKEVSVLWENPCEASSINAENIEQMQYLNAVIDESMRLYPPVYAAYRDVKEETEIGGYQLKKNTLIILSMYVTHRHPELWVNPDEFNPERFINKKTKGFSFYPYGGGKRICLGMHLAKLEIATILALLVANLKFELEPGFKIKKEIYVVLRPKNGLPLTVSALGK